MIAYAHTVQVQYQLFSIVMTPQKKQSHRHSLYNVMSHVILFAYSIKLHISRQGTELQKLCEFQ